MGESNKKKVTLYLDTDTLAILKAYSLDVLRSGSLSEAVRVLAKEYEQKLQSTESPS